jgi:hypothetical protein
MMSEKQLQDMLRGAGLPASTFTEAEVAKAGGDLNSMDSTAWYKLVQLRRKINAPINFFHNGLNSGAHSSTGHRLGKAFDFWTPAPPKLVYYSAIEVGLLKLGVYQNEKRAFGYHVECSNKFATWYGHREEAGAPWVMESIFRAF